jgi:hypothetical protein
MNLFEIAHQFELGGEIIQISPFGTGHINDTFLIETKAQKYILQRINHEVFKNPVAVMENIALIGKHQIHQLQALGKPIDRQMLRLVFTLDKKSYFKDIKENYWRVYFYVSDTITFDIITTPQQAYEAGKGFGKFQRLLSDLNPQLLQDTIPQFHHLGWRYEQLETAIERDIAQRKSVVEKELNFILSRKNLATQLTEAIKSGKLPLRVTHNDTKINNLLFDKSTQNALCAIDLDTVMAGTVIYDFGDLMRTSLSLSAEDEIDLSKITIRMDIFEALTKGYLSETKYFITSPEKELLVFGGQIITLIMGIRFLTDYLSGDIYYKTQHPNHNLDRCRTQLKLVEKIEEKYLVFKSFIAQF